MTLPPKSIAKTVRCLQDQQESGWQWSPYCSTQYHGTVTNSWCSTQFYYLKDDYLFLRFSESSFFREEKKKKE